MEAVLDRRDALAQCLDVEMALGRDPHRVRTSELEQLTAGRDQGLRGDAVPEVGGTAHDVALDEGDIGAERRRDTRARVAGGTTTQNDDARHTCTNSTSGGSGFGPT